MLPRSPMLATLLSSVLAGEAGTFTRRAKIAAIFYGLIGLLVSLGLFFGLIAGYIATAARFGPVEAAIGFCVGFLGIAVVLYLAYRIYTAREKKKAQARRAADFSSAGIAAALALAPTLMRGNMLLKLGVPTVAVLGYFIFKENAKPRLKDFRGRDDLN